MHIRAQFVTLFVTFCFIFLSSLIAKAQAFDVKNVSIAGSTTSAGKHPDLTISMEFPDSPSGFRNGQLRSLELALPTGLMGSAAAPAQCTDTQFKNKMCPQDSLVGRTTITDVLPSIGEVPFPGAIYSLVPENGEAALLGVHVDLGGFGADMFIKAPINPRIPGDIGLTAKMNDVPDCFILSLGQPNSPSQCQFFNSTTPHSCNSNDCFELPLAIKRITMTLYGRVTAEKKPFLTNPTSCEPVALSVIARGYLPAIPITEPPLSSDPVQRSASYQVTDCGDVNIAPSLIVEPTDTDRIGTPSAYTVGVRVPNTGGDPVASHIRDIDFAFPAGLSLSPSLAVGSDACSQEAFGKNQAGPATCPSASILGDARLVTPILGEFTGKVYLGQPDIAAGRYPMYLEAVKGGIRVKIEGVVQPQADGQVLASFHDLPQVPFSLLLLEFRGGDRSIFVNPDQCGTHTTTAKIVPWSSIGKTPVSVDSSFTTSADGNGSACSKAVFAPEISAFTSTVGAGDDPQMTFEVGRSSRSPLLKKMSVDLPVGLTGRLAGLPVCPDEATKTGACPGESQVGEVSAVVGSANATTNLSGPVYLTGPQGGSPAGFLFALPAKIGPVDLGVQLIPARIVVRNNPFVLGVETADLPTSLAGIRLNIQKISLRVTKQPFLINPTSCSAKTFSAKLTSVDGETVERQAPFQAQACDRLPFTPSFKATLMASGQTKKGNHPSLSTVISLPGGSAGMDTATVKMPSAVKIDAKNVAAACLVRDPEACPAGSQIGVATATTSLLSGPLSGPVFFAFSPQAGPGLLVRLRGPISLTLEGKIQVGKQVTAIFNGLPDVPINEFKLTLTGGKRGALLNDRALCATPAKKKKKKKTSAKKPGKILQVVQRAKKKKKKKKVPSLSSTLQADAAITAQNGKRAQIRSAVAVQGCPKK